MSHNIKMTTVLAMLYINTDKTDFKCLTIGAQLFQVGFPSMILASYIAEHGHFTLFKLSDVLWIFKILLNVDDTAPL